MAAWADSATVARLSARIDSLADTTQSVAGQVEGLLTVPVRHELPTWLLLLVPALAALLAALGAQLFRVVLDGLRRREQIRKVLFLEILAAQEYLERLSRAADTWNIPAGESAFWTQMDSSMRGFDEVYVDLVLFPTPERDRLTLWFLKVRSLRYQAAGLGKWLAEDQEAGIVKDQIEQAHARRFDRMRDEALSEAALGTEVFDALVASKPANPFLQWILGVDREPGRRPTQFVLSPPGSTPQTPGA